MEAVPDAQNPRIEDTHLQELIGARSAKLIAQEISAETVGQLLDYLPRKHVLRGQLSSIDQIEMGENITLIAEVISHRSRNMRHRKGMIFEVTVIDSEGQSLIMTFFNGYRAKQELVNGRVALFSGKVGEYKGTLTMNNPDFITLEENDKPDPEHSFSSSTVENIVNRPIPIYTSKPKLSSWVSSKIIHHLLDEIDLNTLDEPIDPTILDSLNLPTRAQAYAMIHQPEAKEDFSRAMDYFKFEEAYILQSALAQRKKNQEDYPGHAWAKDPVVVKEFDKGLPFQRTGEQERIGEVLASKLDSDIPMNVLVQGDVGSGKTLVAVRAMLQIVAAGGQAVLLAPTEVLATQHYFSLLDMLGDLARPTAEDILGLNTIDPRVSISLLTGSLKTKARRETLLDIATGTSQIIVGTHAVLSKDVHYFNLGLVVIDEQHRFGVNQREALRSTAYSLEEAGSQDLQNTQRGIVPHVLVMTATPIPRTLAMTIFGTLDIETLNELPAGRKEVKTHVVNLDGALDSARNQKWENRIWERAYEEVHKGRQVYVVCPTIYASDAEENSSLNNEDSSSSSTLASVEKTYEKLKNLPLFNQAGHELTIGMLNGAMSIEEKNEVMGQFEVGRIDILVATTIIEVGVNVPNASMMIILDAQRFGISQLHQLRGRVGRGNTAGICLLVTDVSDDSPSLERLRAVEASNDGFVLSVEDIKHRREGNILGSTQSGRASGLRFVRIIEDAELLEQAWQKAEETLAQDPSLEKHPKLARAIAQSLSDQEQEFMNQT